MGWTVWVSGVGGSQELGRKEKMQKEDAPALGLQTPVLEDKCLFLNSCSHDCLMDLDFSARHLSPLHLLSATPHPGWDHT